MTKHNEILDNLNLPNSYLSKIYTHLESLAKEAIDDSDLHSGRQLLTLVISIQELKKQQQKELSHKKIKPLEQSKDLKRSNYSKVGYSTAAKEMRDAIINLASQNLLNLDVDISSRTLYSIMERHHLSKLEPSKLDVLTLHISDSEDRQQWKDAISQALILLIQEDFLVKTGRYSYTWTEHAKEHIRSLNTVNNESNLKKEEEKNVKDSLLVTETPNELQQPFAAFSKPRIYDLTNKNGTVNVL